jgi:monoamine oxidase
MARGRALRVVVVGAGAAGLAAAARLARSGVAVTVLEARDRIGGRIDTRTDAALGLALEHGAEFVHGRPGETLALARRAGARVRTVPERHPQRRGGRLVDATATFAKAQELLEVGPRDDEPFAAALRRHAPGRSHGDAALMAEDFVRGFYLADPRTASSLALARMTRSIEETGETISRVEGGYARILEPLVRAIRAGGGELRLSTAVRELRWRRGAVEARARGIAGGNLPPIAADRAVVTLPVSALRDGDVRFVPALAAKRKAAAALTMGPIVKVLLRFRRPPWLEAKSARLRRLSFLHVARAPVPVFWTLAPIEAPVLVGWAGGPDAERLAGRPEADVLRAAVRSAARGLSLEPGAIEDRLDGASVADWTRDPFARGGYAVFPAGSEGASEVLADSVDGTLFFAGEATAGARAGTVDGAVMTGERAARQVLASR